MKLQGEKIEEIYLVLNLQSIIILMVSSDHWLSTHIAAAETVAEGGTSTAFSLGLQQIQEQSKPEETIITPSQRVSPSVQKPLHVHSKGVV